MSILDPNCNKVAEVLLGYDSTLNQTDIQTNKNKFYIMQVLKHSGGFDLYIRYGRIGEGGKITYTPGSQAECCSKFASQFKSKTGNAWKTDYATGSINGFSPHDGKYFLCQKQKVDVSS